MQGGDKNCGDLKINQRLFFSMEDCGEEKVENRIGF